MILMIPSSEAHYFAKNVGAQSSHRVILLSKVIVGTPKIMYAKDTSLTRPPENCDSVSAIVFSLI
jgi:hypothetical protein